MAFEDIVDSVKEWLNNRLKNPYFASVAAVWIVVNRIELFGLFNFNDTQTVQDRLLWIQQQYQKKDIWGLGVFTGFSGAFWFALSFGVITMVLFKYAKVFSAIIYNFSNKGAIWLQRKDKPHNWVEREYLEELQELHRGEREGFEKNKVDLIKRVNESEGNSNKFKQERDIAVQTQANLNSKVSTMENEIGNLNTEIQTLLKENRELKEIKLPLTTGIKDDIDNNDVISSVFGTTTEPTETEKKVQKSFDEATKKYEINEFLKNENSQYFDSIVDDIIKQIPLKVLTEIRNYYISEKLITIKGNLAVLTDKGEEYFREFLQRNNEKKQENMSEATKVRGVRGGVR